MAADRAKDPIQVGISAHPRAFMAEIPDMLAPGLQLDEAQVGARPDMISTIPACRVWPWASVWRGSFVHIGHRSAFFQPRPGCARSTPGSIPGPHKHAVQRLLHLHAARDIQENALSAPARRQGGKFPFIRHARPCPSIVCSNSGCCRSAVAQVGEDHSFARPSSGSRLDLGTLPASSTICPPCCIARQRLQKLIRRGRQGPAQASASGRQLKVTGLQAAQIRPPPGFFLGGRAWAGC